MVVMAQACTDQYRLIDFVHSILNLLTNLSKPEKSSILTLSGPETITMISRSNLYLLEGSHAWLLNSV